MSSIYSIGQMNQLADRLEAEGFTPDDITGLGQYKNLSGIRGLFRGTHELKLVRNIIDCDADPYRPDGWKVEEHRKGGQMKWDFSKIQLYLSKNQTGGKYTKGNKLREELTDKPVLNANVLDYLLAHPELIPEKWKGKFIFFWGTIYCDSVGDLVVRCLGWGGHEWCWHYYWLGHGWDDRNPAALLAS